MTKAEAPPSVADESVTFIQHQLPGLEDGTYQLDLNQHVNDSAGKPISGDTLKRSYRFAVTGDRFRLSNPEQSVASTFPADNATGEYDTVLAHVVFASTSFPWMRAPTTKKPKLPAPGQSLGAEVDVPTWLAVLLLDDDDVAAFPAGTLELDPVTRKLGNLFPVDAYPESKLPATTHSYFDGATDTSGLEVDEHVDDPVQTIDVPLALFADIAPTLADLKLSAHVRQVAVENKPVALGAAPATDPLGAFSVVVGNRLPQPSRRTRAYLVSLEGLEGFLPSTEDGGTLTNPKLKLTDSLRLAVLQSWSFYSKGGSATFVAQLEALNDRKDASDASNTDLRLTKPGASAPVTGALAAGYVPMDHDLRTGETTVSWYRGPLSPVDAESKPIKLPISSPDEAMIFDPTTGLFDVSLSAAWTIGRLAALQDKTFATQLYAWKKGLARDVVDSVEREIVDEALGGLLSASTDEGRAGNPLLHQVMQAVRTNGDTP